MIRQFAALAFPLQGETVHVTASFGVAGVLHDHVHKYGALLRKAGQMLYEAKRAGRNLARVCYPQ